MTNWRFTAATLIFAPIELAAQTSEPPAVEGFHPALPELLSPYLSGDRPALGDYRWYRGKLAGASEDQIALTATAEAYSYECLVQHQKETDAKLRAMDIEPIARNEFSVAYRCSAFLGLNVPAGTSWEVFQKAIDRVRPWVAGYIAANDRALELAEDENLDRAGQLRARYVADQTARSGIVGPLSPTGHFAAFDALEKNIAQHMLMQNMAKIDAANSRWLSSLIATDGWPRASAVGKQAAHDAWLLVQHADADPVLQLTVLRQMKPMVASGDAASKDYAYLYDRVMIALKGRQRYATQFECRNGERVPQPLEEGIAAADRSRAEMGMETVAANTERLESGYGACKK